MSGASCLACGNSATSRWATASDVEYGSSPERFSYVRCSDCDALSINPVPRERLGEIYPPTYYSFGEGDTSLVQRVKQWLDRRMFRKIFAALPGGRLSALDVGGGSGWLLTQACRIEPRLNHTVVVDIDDKVRSAAQAAGHDFFLGRIEDFNSADRFDLILVLNLIEHVEDPVAVLAKLRGFLTPAGRILVKTPNHDSLDARLFRNHSWGGYHCPRHWVIFTPESFRSCAGKAGMHVKSLAFTQGAPFWAVSVLEYLSRKRIVRISYDRPMWRHALFGPLIALFAAFDMARKPFSRTSQMFIQLENSVG